MTNHEKSYLCIKQKEFLSLHATKSTIVRGVKLTIMDGDVENDVHLKVDSVNDLVSFLQSTITNIIRDE